MSRPALIKTGFGIVVISVLLAVVPTVIEMAQLFANLAEERGVEVSQLSDSVSSSMMWTVMMMPFIAIGLIILIIGIFSSAKDDNGPEGDAS